MRLNTLYWGSSVWWIIQGVRWLWNNITRKYSTAPVLCVWCWFCGSEQYTLIWAHGGPRLHVCTCCLIFNITSPLHSAPPAGPTAGYHPQITPQCSACQTDQLSSAGLRSAVWKAITSPSHRPCAPLSVLLSDTSPWRLRSGEASLTHWSSERSARSGGSDVTPSRTRWGL